MATAILVDGAFFLKRYRGGCGHHVLASEVARDLHNWALAHLRDRDGIHRRELYRIFVYDAPPLTSKVHKPISKAIHDFSKTEEAIFRTQFHQELLKMRKVALRLGHLIDHKRWVMKSAVQDELRKGKMSLNALTDEHFSYDVKQKGVDMRIGLDISSLAYKRFVDQIVLVAGDADFVPAAKLARREGIDFILDPMWQDVSRIADSLHEHIDGLRSTCPKPT
ncbi:NYN domain-containing protein [Chromobacterium phragmitis]|uniref:NYN domain-containing protein n=1 Tax=Chromobacterium phragmitis TaxID=2202141 RepID=A0A344UJB7_9NEIS|nr:NYN domain-containing protein [Chromobacterium phragmitis]AXE35365.1 NYN domain-containing protein [Chromobacterium phragmitis]